MIILDATNRSLEAVLSGAVSTNELSCVASWADKTSSALTPGATVIATNGATPVTIVAAPASSTQRMAKYINIWNKDTTAKTITIQYNDNSTIYKLVTFTIQVGESLVYTEYAGWHVLTITGQVKIQSGLAFGMGDTIFNQVQNVSSAFTAQTLTSNTTFANYCGIAARAYTSAQIIFRTSQQETATVTWSEIAIAKGTPVLNAGSPSLTTMGFADVTTQFTAATGLQTATVAVSGINIGDPLWVLFGCQTSGTIAGLRGAMLMTADVSSGLVASKATTRPSTMGGGTVFTAINTVPLWWAIQWT